MNIRKGYFSPINEQLLNFEYGTTLRKELGMKHCPDSSFYEWFMKKMHEWGTNGFLKQTFKIHGKENLEDGKRQLFLFNHELRHDPFAIEAAITLASGNTTPIPAPAYPDYILNKGFSFLLQKFYSYPIYSKSDGNILINGKNLSYRELTEMKDLSLEYSEYCLFHYGRLLIFPTGELSQDGKQIKGISNGKPVKGRLGSAEILWRFYHHIHEKEFWKNEKEIQVIPGYISYYPLDFLRNPFEFLKNGKEECKVRVRFGKSLDEVFKKEVIEKFYSLENRYKTFRNPEKKEELKIKLQKKFMDNAMEEIGALITINMGHIGSRIIFDFAKKKIPFVNNNFFIGKIKQLVGKLRYSKFYLSEHFDNPERIEGRFDYFLKECKEKGFLKKEESHIELNLNKILFIPDDAKVRDENRILYNSNKLEHLEDYKQIEKEILK
jgi:hypothetical protein